MPSFLFFKCGINFISVFRLSSLFFCGSTWFVAFRFAVGLLWLWLCGLALTYKYKNKKSIIINDIAN
jgi:hypothetical protein